MTIRLRTIFLVVAIVIIAWFLYQVREILTPFILAAVFAYIFNPVVNFFTNKVKLPRTLSILIIYLILVGIIGFLGFILTTRIIEESEQLRTFISSTVKEARSEINTLPDFIRPAATDSLTTLEKSKFFSATYWLSFFPAAISRLISFFLFLVAGFYFLKESNVIFRKILNLFPGDSRVDAEILIRRMNLVFASYLRGQLFLMFFIGILVYIALAILGVRFALIIAVISGFAEIVPIFGPIFSGAIAAIVTLISGAGNFSISNLNAALIVVLIYFGLNQLENYLIVPHVMGRATNLHPLIIIFAVAAGGSLFGLLGLILAVPIAGVIKILLVYFMDKINENQLATKKVPGKQ